ncbi:MAG: glycosyltransferase family 39 protein [Chloroflexi bacterium]|nr:glycosyltransferase family 39 protein [Chloroflexota bacterium]
MPVEFFYLLLALLGLVAMAWGLVRRWARRGRDASSPPAPSSNTRQARLTAWLLTPVASPLKLPLPPEHPRPRPVIPPTPTSVTLAQLRPTITILLVGGLLLTVMAQVTYTAVFLDWKKWLVGLVVVGVALFLGGARLTMRPRPHRYFLSLSWRLSHFFHLAGWQITLLSLAPLFAWLARLAAGSSLQALSPAVALLAWALAVICLVVGSYRWWQAVPFTVSRGEVLGLVGLFLLAFLLRVTFLSQYPNTLSGDEGSAGLTAAAFRTGEFNNVLGVGWFSFPSFYYWIQSWGIHLLGQTVAGLRFTSAVAGSLTVVAVYGLGRALFNRWVGLIAAAILLASHYHIQFSRIGLNNIWDGLFLALALAALWYGWKTGWRGAFIVCGLAVGLGQYFYVSLRILPLLLLVWAGFAFLFQRSTFRRRWPDLILTGFIALIVFLPLLLYFASHPMEFNAPLQRVTVFGGWLELEQMRTGYSASQVILDQMKNTALGITHEPLRHWYNPGTPLLLAGPAALFLLGVLWSVLAFDLRYLLLWLPLVAHVLLGGFSQDAPASQRFVWVVPVVVLFVALPLARTVDWLQRAWPKRQKWVAGFAAAFLLWLMLTDLHYYFFQVYQSGYVLGGINTEAATEIAVYLREHPQQGQVVYFYGLPRMGYSTHSTIPYLAPHMYGIDIMEPLPTAPGINSQDNLLFIFLPERLEEFTLVQAAFPNGTYQEFNRETGEPLFAVYDVP